MFYGESFMSKIKRLNGKAVLKNVKLFENLKRKKVNQLCNLTFLKRCRCNNLIPNFIKIKHNIQTPGAKKIYEKASLTLLRNVINTTRNKLYEIDKQVYELEIRLRNQLSNNDWKYLEDLLYRRLKNHENGTRSKKISKFNNLFNKQVTNSYKNNNYKNDKLVVNLSSYQLSDTARSVLSKGLDFAVAPSRIPVEDIISNIEASISHLPDREAAEIRFETTRILRRAKLPQKNLTSSEYQALKDLKSNINIIIAPADKGKATVLMDKDEYINKANDLLNDPTTYIKLLQNPNNKFKLLTTKLLKESNLSTETIKKLTPQDPLIPRFYGLPKIHKPNTPLRPIVSCIGSTTYELSKYLNAILKPYIGLSNSFIKNTQHFIEVISKQKLSSNDLMVSFDVSSLFTKVPILDTLQLLQRQFDNNTIKLFEHCLTTSFFLFNGEYYKQIDGVAMGSPISPSIANYYMEYFEEEALKYASKKPKLWLRYVDDVFAIWSHGLDELQIFLQYLNNRHPNIKFSIEKEINGTLPFLDVKIERKLDGTLIHSVYRKPTHTDQYINANSHHHPAQKLGTIRTLYNRATIICHQEKLQEELEHLKKVFIRNGFNKEQIKKFLRPKTRPTVTDDSTINQNFVILPFVSNISDKIGRILSKHKIKVAYNTTTKIKNLLNPLKDKIPYNTCGVYQVPCTCGKVYIGETGRTIDTRLKEHKRHLRLIQPTKSAIAEHALDTLHDINFEKTKTISKTKNWKSRKIREAIEIIKHPNNFNRDNGYELSDTWLPVIS